MVFIVLRGVLDPEKNLTFAKLPTWEGVGALGVLRGWDGLPNFTRS